MLAQSGFWNDAEQDLVVIPSISFPPIQLAKINGIEHYEERMLYHLFHLRHSKFSRILYVTSLPLDPAIMHYYVSLIVDSIAHAKNESRSREELMNEMKNRIVFLSTYDGNKLVTLTEKILSRPRLLARIQNFMNSKLSPLVIPYLSVYRGTETEFNVGNILGLPVHAADSSLLFWGGKAGSRSIFKNLNVPHCDGTYSADKNVDVVINKIIDVCKRNPGSSKGMLKLDEGFSGKGNALVDLKNVQKAIIDDNNFQNIVDQVKISLKTARYFGESETWDSFSKQIEIIGAIFELFVEFKDSDLLTTSPSVQVYIALDGNVEIISSHEQILENQHYLGCEFPAYRPYRIEIAEYSYRIGQFLAKQGVTGHFGVDFLCVQNSYSPVHNSNEWDESDSKYGNLSDWSIFAIEINLRMTGTTHPMMTLKMLTDGKLMESGIFMTSDINPHPCFYVSYDLYFEASYKRLIPLDLLDIIERCKWRYNHATKSGAVFHMLGAISEHGSIGLTCIGKSREECKYLSRLKLPQLKEHAFKYGLSVSGTKSELMSSIDKHLSNINLKHTKVLAIDLGLVNLSYISIETSQPTHTPSVLDWKLVDLKLLNYDPVYYTLQIQKLLNDILKCNPTNIIIEAQSWRTGFQIPHTILKLKSLEAILTSCIITRGFMNVELISPKKISDYLSSMYPEFENGNYRAKKLSSVKLVKGILEKQKFNGCIDIFQESKKKDDLADSFLLAFVWNEWRKNSCFAMKELLKK